MKGKTEGRWWEEEAQWIGDRGIVHGTGGNGWKGDGGKERNLVDGVRFKGEEDSWKERRGKEAEEEKKTKCR